ncbi:unnamed protein product [Closterium sp. NIES-54]
MISALVVAALRHRRPTPAATAAQAAPAVPVVSSPPRHHEPADGLATKPTKPQSAPACRVPIASPVPSLVPSPSLPRRLPVPSLSLPVPSPVPSPLPSPSLPRRLLIPSPSLPCRVLVPSPSPPHPLLVAFPSAAAAVRGKVACWGWPP